MKFFPFALLLLACNQTSTAPMPTLSAIKENRLLFADGSFRDIPHWGDSSYVTFFMVRHAERDMEGRDPQLTAAGRARAERLGRILSECSFDVVYSTAYERTRQTAEPVQRRSKSPSVMSYLPEKQMELLDQLVATPGGKRIFIVGHQNTVPMALNYLSGDFNFKNIPDFEFGRFYIAVVKEMGETEVLEMQY